MYDFIEENSTIDYFLMSEGQSLTVEQGNALINFSLRNVCAEYVCCLSVSLFGLYIVYLVAKHNN